MQCRQLFALILAACSVLSFGESRLHAQTGSPFDLIYRLDTATQIRLATPSPTVQLSPKQVDVNPFDLKGRAAADTSSYAEKITAALPVVAESPPNVAPSNQQFSAILSIALLLLLSLCFVLQGNTLRRMWGGLQNENLLKRLERDQRKGGYTLWAFVGALSLGVFLYVAIHVIGYIQVPLNWPTLGLFAGGAVGLTLLKLLTLTLLGALFPLQKTVDYYRALIYVWVAILGILLFPASILMLFGAPDLAIPIAYGGLAIVVLGYLFRSLRALASASHLLLSYPLHFILYLCALEIGPLAVAYQLLAG